MLLQEDGAGPAPSSAWSLPREEAGRGGRPGLFDVPEFRAEVREEDLPYRRGGFTDEASEGHRDPFPQESVRLLLDRTEEMEENLSRLNETADEIRKELTI